MPPTKLNEQQAEVAVNRRLLGLFGTAALTEPNPDPPRHAGHRVSTSHGKVLPEADEDAITATLRLEAWHQPAPSDETWPRTTTVPIELTSGKLNVDEIEQGTRPLDFRLPTSGRWEARLSWPTGNLERATVLVQFRSPPTHRQHPPTGDRFLRHGDGRADPARFRRKHHRDGYTLNPALTTRAPGTSPPCTSAFTA
ncbi:hypothetical protein B0I33_101517 [Prauserella shujinwangii]|uniref:Uncharacterized protein n=1 Tax=Prauserella shujinwangii TaxID=1453103 RepID=A0A2T0M3P4_9PSEU|nr:hypothetical protein [Prauserella shujinwangii]PRX51363.1 hypothetical protein B0I33_101517 [Prauserella shujinwangii]